MTIQFEEIVQKDGESFKNFNNRVVDFQAGFNVLDVQLVRDTVMVDFISKRLENRWIAIIKYKER